MEKVTVGMFRIEKIFVGSELVSEADPGIPEGWLDWWNLSSVLITDVEGKDLKTRQVDCECN